MNSQIHITQQFANMCNSLNKGEIHKLRTPNVLFNWADGLFLVALSTNIFFHSNPNLGLGYDFGGSQLCI